MIPVNTILSSKYQIKMYHIIMFYLYRVKQDSYVARKNLEKMNLSYLNFNFNQYK